MSEQTGSAQTLATRSVHGLECHPWRVAVAAGLAACAAGGLMLGPGLGYDESATISAISRSYPELVRLVQSVDAVHFAYYCAAKAWAAVFGATAAGLRSLSLAVFGLAVAGLCRFVQRERGALTALAACVVFMALPGVVLNSVTARGQVFALACATWSFVLLQRALRGTATSPRRSQVALWAPYGLVVAAMAAFNLTAVLVLAAHVVYWMSWAKSHGKGSAGLPVAAGAAGLAVLPLAVVAWGQRAQISWIRPAASAWEAAWRAGLWLFDGPDHRLTTAAKLGGGAAALVCLALGAGAILARRGKPSFAVLGWACYLVPAITLFATTQAGFGLYRDNYLLAAAPGVALAAGEGLAALLRRWRTAGVLVLAVFVAALVPAHIALTADDALDSTDLHSLAELGRDADQVAYLLPQARSIGIAYPALLQGADDVLLQASPEASGTLRGENAPLSAWNPAGRVVVYEDVTAYPDGVRPEARDLLALAGCQATGEAFGEARFRGTVFACPLG
jgi:mannosyltransferase